MRSHSVLARLRREVAAHGCDHKATGRVVGELLLHICLALTGMLMFLLSGSWWLRLVALVVAAFGALGAGTNTHTSSHYATSSKRWVNELLTYFGYPFFLGLSATFWWHQHVMIHHPSPNVVGVDQDADLSPWFAMTQTDVRSHQGWRRFYHEHLQWIFFPLALSANVFNFLKTGWLHVVRNLSDPGKRKRAHWIDLGAMLLHYAAYLGVPLFFFSAGDLIAFYLLRSILLGYGMFAVLAPGHFPAEAARLSADQTNADYLLVQTANTIDYRTGWIGRLLTSGLGYQIEHHLFPNLSHIHYRKISPLVEQMCKEHGLPYRAFRWHRAIWKCWMVIRLPGPVITDAELLRLPVGAPNTATAGVHQDQ